VREPSVRVNVNAHERHKTDTDVHAEPETDARIMQYIRQSED